jgi:hypothetical protein
MNIFVTTQRPNRNTRASVLIAVLAILAITFVLFTVNSKTLIRLSREVDAVNKRQTNHWLTVSAQNTAPAAKQ